MNQYIARVKWLIDNCNFAVMNQEYYDEAGMFVENSHYLGGQLDSGFYRVNTVNGVREFHYKEVVDFLEHYRMTPSKTYDFDSAIKLNDGKKIVVGFSIHPRIDNVITYRKNFFDKLFSDTYFLQLLISGKVHMYLYYGYEADNFNDNSSINNDFEKMLDDTIKDYNLPYNSVFVLSSNLMGYQNFKKVMDFDKHENVNNPRIIYDNFYEVNTFKSLKGDIDLDYAFDEYIDNCKKTDKYCLRLNRTTHSSRDLMLYYLEKSRNIDKSIIEHSTYNSTQVDEIFNKIEKQSHINVYLNKYREITPYLKSDEYTHLSINNKLPLIASPSEINGIFSQHYSNETIPHDVYKNSIFSWVSTTFADKYNQVFLNMSTFNPILYYHPLIFIGNNNTVTYLRKCGYLSYEFLHDEDLIDYSGDYSERCLLSMIEVDKLFNTSKDNLIGLISENRDVLEYNKKKLIECDSIRRILDGVYNILNNNNIGHYF